MTDNLPVTRYQSPLADRMAYAKALAASDLLPRAYQGKPANVLLAIEYGDALGIAPVAAIQGVHIVDAKPTASAQLIGALVRRAGHRLRVVVSADGQAAKATIIRSDDPDFTFESVWTMDRAREAGLAGKGTWKAYPTNLLKARAITEVARDACPEALSGVAYTPEELGVEDAPAPARVEVTANFPAVEPERPVERISPAAPVVDEWSTVEPPVDEDGVILEAEVVEDRPYQITDTQGTSGPLARSIATRPATEKQVNFVATLAKKAGHLTVNDYLDSTAARDALGCEPSQPLTDGHARTLIDALKAEVG